SDARSDLRSKGGVDVGHTVGDVMQPRTTLLEEARDGGVRAQRLEQFDRRWAAADEHDPDALRLDGLGQGPHSAQQGFVVRKNVVDRWNRDRDMVQYTFHGLLPGRFLATRCGAPS